MAEQDTQPVSGDRRDPVPSPPDETTQGEPIRFVDANDPDEGVLAFLRSIFEAGAEETIHSDWEREQMERFDV